MLRRFSKSLPFILTLCATFTVHAVNIPFAGLNVEIPDSMEYKLYDTNMLQIAGHNYNVYLATFGFPDMSDRIEFNIDNTLKTLDKTIFLLKDYTLVSEVDKTEGLYYPECYVRRHYNYDKNKRRNVVTHTFYTPKRPYVAAVEYLEDSTPAVFDEIINSIDDNSTILSRQLSAVSTGFGLIAIMVIVGSFLCAIIGIFCDRDKHAVKIATAVTVILGILAFWYAPSCILLNIIAICACFVLGWCAASLPLEMLLTNILENI